MCSIVNAVILATITQFLVCGFSAPIHQSSLATSTLNDDPKIECVYLGLVGDGRCDVDSNNAECDW